MTRRKKSDPRAGAVGEHAEQKTPATDEVGSGAPEATAPDRSVRRLEEKLAETEQEVAELKGRWLRATAELDNYRKRMEREIGAARDQGTADLARRLLDAVDNLRRALDSLSEEERQTPLARGVEIVHAQLLEALQSFGIEPIDALHKPFDPYLHEAVLEEERDDVEPGTVLDELLRGYRMGDRLLRAAQVRVSRAPEQDAASGDPDAEEREPADDRGDRGPAAPADE